VSAEWRHVSTDRLGDLHGLWCDIDAQPWPCDAEQMRVERDAAIRRAADVGEAFDAAADVAEHFIRKYGLTNTSGDRHVTRRNARNSTLNVIALARAALRSQESQKPPETEERT